MLCRVLALCGIWVAIAPGTMQVPLKKHAGVATSSESANVATDTQLVVPVFVNDDGSAIPHGLRAMRIGRRNYVKIAAFGKEFVLNMTHSSDFVTSSVLAGHRANDSTHEMLHAFDPTCYHRGSVMVGNVTVGRAALSACGGLRGLIAIDGDVDYLIEPLPSEGEGESDKMYLLHRRRANLRARSPVCGLVQRGSLSEQQWRHRTERAAVTERYVEIALVADRSMQDFYGSDLRNYLYTLMNMVSLLFKDSSLNTALNIVLVKLPPTGQNGGAGFVSGTAQESVESFCAWQNNLRKIPPNHDIAVLLTRQQICTEWDSSCSVVGAAPEGGGCAPTRSCNINKDIGPATAYTIAHEIGHNLGMLHDDNPTQPCPSGLYLMTSSLATSTNLNRWSTCSQQQLFQFFESNTCLDNRPEVALISTETLVLPGTVYSADNQCQWLFDVPARYCEGPMETEQCSRLYCNTSGVCKATFVPPVPGTNCTYNGTANAGRCFDGVCVQAALLESPVSGGWGSWGDWSSCSATCGTGVQYQERSCNSPVPKYGGSFCKGSSRQYQTCNTDPCPGKMTYRDELCKHWKPEFHAYYPTYTVTLPCSLYCTNDKVHILLSNKLNDGTSCYIPSSTPGNAQQQGVCVSSECIPVGCGHLLNTTTTKDVCGVTCGNGSTCTKVTRTFVSQSNLIIPKGATTISVIGEELSNYTLALNTSVGMVNVTANPPTLPAAGTTWTFTVALPMALRATGPTEESVALYLIPTTGGVLSNVTGVSYTYYVPRPAVV